MEVEINATESIQRESNPTVNDVDRFDQTMPVNTRMKGKKVTKKKKEKRYNIWMCDNAFI